MTNARMLGQLGIGIEESDPATSYLSSEFGSLPSTAGPAPVNVQRVSRLELSGVPAARYGRVSFSGNMVILDYGWWHASIEIDSSSTTVRFHSDEKAPTGKLSVFHERAGNWNFLSSDEDLAKGVVYDVLDQAIQGQQTSLDQTFIHASSIEKDGTAVMIAGWGGVGKTSSVVQLIREYGYRFLSDDLGVIAKSGKIFRSPKRLQVYPYNVSGLPNARKELLKDRSWVDRTQWTLRERLKGPKGVRRRVSAEQFFGAEKVASEADLGLFIHLERGTWAKPLVSTLLPSDAAKRSAAVLMYELNPLFEVSCAEEAHAASRSFRVSDWAARAEEIMLGALSGVPCVKVQIPSSTGPEELASLVEQVVETYGKA